MTENVSTEIHAFCLMENHIHILIHTEGDNLSAVMQKILLNYVKYFNKKYDITAKIINKIIPRGTSIYHFIQV